MPPSERLASIQRSFAWMCTKRLAKAGSSITCAMHFSVRFAQCGDLIFAFRRIRQPKVVFQSVFDFEAQPRTAELQEMFETLRALSAYVVPNTKLAIWSRVWTKQKLIDFIRQLPARHNNSSYVRTNHPREFMAAVRQFGR